MKEKRIRITHVHERDSYYHNRESYIGLTGKFKFRGRTSPGYYAGYFFPDKKNVVHGDHMVFYAVRYVKI